MKYAVGDVVRVRLPSGQTRSGAITFIDRDGPTDHKIYVSGLGGVAIIDGNGNIKAREPFTEVVEIRKPQ